tara:strand:+ start:1450 stop:1959 length:510 start_codon:yes stop_codon:yes gene_type:complete
MDQNVDKNFDIKSKILDIFQKNKIKIYSLVIILFILLFFLTFMKIDKEKNNNLMSEKYIQAGIYLSKNKDEESRKILEEIIFNKHKFYSILSLNIILEKNLEKNFDKVLSYFEIIEKLRISKSQKNLISFKKALFLLKNNQTEQGNDILNKLIETNSEFKFLAEQVLNK